MWTDQKLTQAADDVVWEGDLEDAFPRARRLMFAAMRRAVTPFHVWEVHRWARAKAEEHAARADALRRIIDASGLEHAGVDALEAHHRRIAARLRRGTRRWRGRCRTSACRSRAGRLRPPGRCDRP